MSQSSLDRAYEKRYGKSIMTTRKKEPEISDSGLFFKILRVMYHIVRITFAGPGQEMQNRYAAYHMLSGLTILTWTLYCIFNLTSIEPFFEEFFSEDTLPFMKGIFAFFLIYKFIHACYIISGLTYFGGFMQVDGKRFEQGYRTGHIKGYPPYKEEKKDVFGEPRRQMKDYMNSKMAGMTNAQKISYMSKYYGGKL